MPRCPIKLGFRHHSAVWFERTRDVKHRWTRFIGPLLNQVKLFDRLFVMNCDRHELVSHAAKTDMTRRPEMRSDGRNGLYPSMKATMTLAKPVRAISRLSTIRHACRIGHVGPGIADEHVSVRHLDRA